MPSTALDTLGGDWLADQVDGLTDTIHRITPSAYNEQNRYLPASVTSMPGYIRYAVNPFMREIVDCFDVDSPVREVNVMKGVQITYSTLLESGVLYYAGHVRTLPMMYMTADKELAGARIENNFIPMFSQSELGDIIRSSDEGNTRKTGKTKDHIQFAGGAYLVPFGARNADKMRSYSICVMLKDEVDAWPLVVGKDGDPGKLSDARCNGYWDRRKIFRGSTPTIRGLSHIERQYKRGDQRQYRVLCKACGYPQHLRWYSENKETGAVGGFDWETDAGVLIPESVAYRCQNCSHPHYEHDKERLFSEDHGAHWHPTARPVEPGIRSYHIPALYSPIGMLPWSACVADYLECWDPVEKKVIDMGAFQVFYNNILAKTFEIKGSKIHFQAVSAHRRSVYRFGQIPNTYAAQYSGSPVLFLTCIVDVHKSNLAVTVFGWCRDARPYVIDYWRFEDEDCTDLSSPVWARLRELVEETEYVADDGKRYRVALTLIDAGYANDTVVDFCGEYGGGVFPILGRDRPGKNQAIKEFAEFTTKSGTVGYRILVDHYKDRMAPVLRREWVEDAGLQKPYHVNVPIDMSDKQLKELTAETRREERDDRGRVWYTWYRPSGRDNELWDNLGYGYAAVEILAWSICIQHFELETIDWPQFWDFLETEKLYYSD